LAVGREIDYVKVKQNDEFLILAKSRLSILEGEYEVVEKFKGEKLVGLNYEPLYPYTKNLINEEEGKKISNAYKVYEASFVTTEDGTGVVHIAPMYGQDDFDLGNRVGLPKHHLVELDGHFVKGTIFYLDVCKRRRCCRGYN
jgi:isoleucyl-tRNA synthetase